MADRVKNDEMPSKVKVRIWKVWKEELRKCKV